MKVLTVVGNRPQFVKSAAVSTAFKAAGIEEVILHTGQHYDRELSGIFFDELGLPEPAYRLGAGSAPREEMLARMRPGLLDALARERPDWALVHGDTNSTLAGARAAVETGVRVAHVESGLRSGDWEMPEERNRVEVDRIAALLFCPDDRSRETLERESVPGRAEVVGDVMYDVVQRIAPLARRRSDALARLGLEPGRYVLATIHREANVRPERLARILDGLARIEWPVVFAAHPRTRSVLERHHLALGPRVRLVPPLSYLDGAAVASQARTIVTDSGGLQKEAYWYGVPCVTARATTEWPDTVELGANVLVDDDPAALAQAVTDARLPEGLPQLYGDGKAAERVAAALRLG